MLQPRVAGAHRVPEDQEEAARVTPRAASGAGTQELLGGVGYQLMPSSLRAVLLW